MPEENELKVEIAPDEPPPQQEAEPVEPSTEDAAVSDLSKQYADMKVRSEADASARRAAEARVAQLERVAHQARTDAVGTRLQSYTAQLAAAETEGTAAEEAYAKAMDQGNFAEAAKAQRRMARAETEISRISALKSDMEAPGGRVPTEAPQYTPPPAADPVEAFIQGKTEPTANWLRSHRDWVTDPSKSAKLTAAHWDAVSRNITLDTPEYFENVEKYIGLRGAPEQQQQRRKTTMPPVAAPTNSRTGSVSGDTVFLTKREAENSEDGTIVWNYDDPSPQKRFRKGDPIGRQEYARRKREMMKTGLYDKSYEQG